MAPKKSKATVTASVTVEASVAANLLTTLTKRRGEVQYLLYKNKNEIQRLADGQGTLKAELATLHSLIASLTPKPVSP
jgi:hypothetical protein